MGNEMLESSDSVRHSRPLMHARQETFDEPLALELGGVLPSVSVVYETYGRLSERKDNAVLVCHAISGDSHVAQHDKDDDAGWWDIAVGPGKAIDTDKYFVICPNILGGCRGSTGPNSVNPATGKPYGPDFPTITVADMVEAQRRLVDALGIESLRAVVGGSMGGHMALTWAQRYGDRLRSVIPLATSPRLTSQALAFDVVGRNAILRDPNFRGGHYAEEKVVPAVGLAIARMIGHITYLSRQAMREKFEATRFQPRDVPTEFEKRFSVGSYLGYQADKFVERFDANSYIRLSMAMDLFDLGATKEELVAALRPGSPRWLVISFDSDWLFPPDQSVELVNALLASGKRVTYANLHSTCGHDAFLLPNDVDRYGEMISAFLGHLDSPGAARRGESGVGGGRKGTGQTLLTQATADAEKDSAEDGGEDDATSIFHQKRLDYDQIMQFIPAGASVLDLGCGSGGLMDRLRRRGATGAARIMGVELEEMEIVRCVGRGLDVVQMDLNRRLDSFADGQFDCVVLSQTLQTIRDVPGVLGEMLRVGRRGVVSFPNFAFHKLRRMLSEEGRAPEAPGGLLHYAWYDTPNIRCLSIKDFRTFCSRKGIRIEREAFLDTEAGRAVTDDPNLNADLAIFVIGR